MVDAFSSLVATSESHVAGSQEQAVDFWLTFSQSGTHAIDVAEKTDVALYEDGLTIRVDFVELIAKRIATFCAPADYIGLRRCGMGKEFSGSGLSNPVGTAYEDGHEVGDALRLSIRLTYGGDPNHFQIRALNMLAML